MTSAPPSNTFSRNWLPLLAGIVLAVLILIVFQQYGKAVPGKNVVQYEEIVRSYKAKQVRAEFTGLLVGIYIGSSLTAFLVSRPAIRRILFIAIAVIGIVVITPWHFALQKEIILLVLPLWIIVGLAGRYSGVLLKSRGGTHPNPSPKERD